VAIAPVAAEWGSRPCLDLGIIEPKSPWTLGLHARVRMPPSENLEIQRRACRTRRSGTSGKRYLCRELGLTPWTLEAVCNVVEGVQFIRLWILKCTSGAIMVPILDIEKAKRPRGARPPRIISYHASVFGDLVHKGRYFMTSLLHATGLPTNPERAPQEVYFDSLLEVL